MSRRTPLHERDPEAGDEALSGDYKRAFRILRRFLWNYWKAIAFVMTLNVLVGVMTSLRPLLLAPALDVFTQTKTKAAESFSELSLSSIGPTLLSIFNIDRGNLMEVGLFIATLLFAATLITAAFTIAAQLVLIRTRACIVRDMSIALYRHLLTLSLSFFHQRKTGDIVSRITSDVRRTAGSLDKIVQQTLRNSIQLLITFTILVRTDPVYTLVVLMIGGLHGLTNRLLGDRVKQNSYELGVVTGDLGARMYESLSGIKTLKMFAAERYDAKNTIKKTQELTDSTIQHSRWNFYQQPIRMLIDAFMVAVVLVLAFYAIQSERMTITAAALFFYLSRQLSDPLSTIFSQGISIKNMLGSAERIYQIFNTENEIKDGTRDVHELEKEVRLEAVSFSYPDGTEAIRNASCEIRKGEFVGLAGPSGSGKTTMVDLLLRLHDCTEGAIFLDDVNIREFRQREYRRQFGIVAQDNFLFNATIRDNIVFNREFDEDRLMRALWIANAQEFVQAMPSGVNTFLGDRGTRLSGGQQQRIAIARAIYGMPSILILDEATSALDSESERQVQKAIDRVAKEITTIVIAHRLSTIRNADKIIVLNKGVVEGVGNHAKLMAENSTYKRLVEVQELDPAGELAGEPTSDTLAC